MLAGREREGYPKLLGDIEFDMNQPNVYGLITARLSRPAGFVLAQGIFRPSEFLGEIVEEKPTVIKTLGLRVVGSAVHGGPLSVCEFVPSAVRYGPGKARCYLQALRNSAPCTDCLLLEMWKPPPSTTRRSGYVVPQKPIRLALEEQARLGTAEAAMSRIAHDHIYALGETGHIVQVAAGRSDAGSAPRSFIGYQPGRFTGCTKRN